MGQTQVSEWVWDMCPSLHNSPLLSRWAHRWAIYTYLSHTFGITGVLAGYFFLSVALLFCLSIEVLVRCCLELCLLAIGSGVWLVFGKVS